MGFKFNLPSRRRILESPNGQVMLRLIDRNLPARSVLISGCPGSGKTTISIWRLIRLRSQGKEAVLFTFQKMLSVALKNLAATKGIEDDCISTLHIWFSRRTGGEWLSRQTEDSLRNILKSNIGERLRNSELIIDEGQDLRKKIHRVLPHFFGPTMVGADDAQRVHEHGATKKEIESILESRFGPTHLVHLQYNYRNSYEIYDFARHFIPDNSAANDRLVLKNLVRTRGRTAEKPDLFSFRTDAQRNRRFDILLRNTPGNIAVLVETKALVDEFFWLATAELGVSASRYHSDLKLPDSLERVVITTYKSAKGMEFDAVIMPEIEPEQVRLANEWFVSCTRAIRSLHIFSRRGVFGVLSKFPMSTYNLVDLA